MSYTLRNRLFYLIVFCTMFTEIPRFFQLNFIGSFLGKDLSFYPICASFLYYIWLTKNKHLKLRLSGLPKSFVFYIVAYISIILFSFVHGLIIYPYYDAIIEGPAGQIDKLPIVYQFLRKSGINISEVTLLKYWMFARPIKGFIVETFWFFSVPILIYHWYKNEPQSGIRIIQKATILATILICIYGILDIFYLSGNIFAQNILIFLNPIVHDIYYNGTWWPPLLWDNQLRSLFAEPSYFGIYAAFAAPWIWYTLLQQNKRRNKICLTLLLFLLSFELFLTKARTANVLLLGQIILLFVITFWYRKKTFLKNSFIIVGIAILAFCSATFSMRFMPGKPNGNALTGHNISNSEMATLYLEDNLGSLTSSTKRSNRSRFSILKASIDIGRDYPLLGVGIGLRQAYIPRYLPPDALNSHEVRQWIQNQKEKGIMKSGFPRLGEYCTRFAETGSLGLLVYLLPSFYLLARIIKEFRSNNCTIEHKEDMIFFVLSWAGIMASGLGDNLSVTCCYWILMGIGYALIYKNKGKNEST